MHNEKDNIEELFSKKFEKFEDKPSDQEWLELSSKLSKSNFLKFSFITFNIYYLMALVAFAGTASFTGIRNIQLTQKVQKLEQTVKSYQKQGEVTSPPLQYSDSMKSQPATSIDEIKPSKTVNTKIENRKKEEPLIKEKSGELEKDVNQPLPNPPVVLKDNSVKPDAMSSIDTTNKPRFRKVKKILVVKPNPVVVKDTVVITKRLK